MLIQIPEPTLDLDLGGKPQESLYLGNSGALLGPGVKTGIGYNSKKCTGDIAFKRRAK